MKLFKRYLDADEWHEVNIETEKEKLAHLFIDVGAALKAGRFRTPYAEYRVED